jgi:hypothetical protein
VLLHCAAVAQLVEASVCRTGCWGFESPAPPVYLIAVPPLLAPHPLAT